MSFFNGKSDDGEDKKNILERLEEQLDKIEERVSNIESVSEFTITNQKTISSVRTQILNPDGSLADVDENTSIIYKVVKNNPASLTVSQDLLQQTQQKKK